MARVEQIKALWSRIAQRLFHPYHRVDESILDHIASNIENGELPRTFSLAKYFDPENNIYFADGMIDGVDLYRMGFESLSDDSKSKIKEAIIAASIGHYDRADRIFLKLSKEYRALGLVDEIQKCVVSEASFINQSALRDYAIECIRHSSEEDLPKIGLMILELYGDQDNYPKSAIRMIALSDEYSLFALWNMRNWENGNEELFDLVKKVHGWGRIHIIKEIKPASKAIRRWILFNGVDNIAPCECAVECYMKSDAGILLQQGMDYEEFKAVGAIIEGLIEGPKKDLSNIKGWRRILKLYLEDAEEHELDIDDLNRLLYFSKYGSDCGFIDFEDSCARVLRSQHNRQKVKIALEKGDGIELARFLEIPYDSILISLIDRDFQSHYSKITYLSDSALFPQVIDIFRREIPLSSIEYDPKDELGLGDEWKEYNQLGFLLQELRHKMPLAIDYVLKGLGSPVDSNRSIATSVLQSWVSDEHMPLKRLSPEAHILLERVHRIEPVKSIKEEMGKLLQGGICFDDTRPSEKSAKNYDSDPLQDQEAMLELFDLRDSTLKVMRYTPRDGFHLEVLSPELGLIKIGFSSFELLLIRRMPSSEMDMGIFMKTGRDLVNLLHERSYTVFPVEASNQFSIVISDCMIDVVMVEAPNVFCTESSSLIDEYRGNVSEHCTKRESPNPGGMLPYNTDNIDYFDHISSALFFDESESYSSIRDSHCAFDRPIWLEDFEIRAEEFSLCFLSGKSEDRYMISSDLVPDAFLIVDDLINDRVFSKVKDLHPLLGPIYEIQDSTLLKSIKEDERYARHIRIEEADFAIDILSTSPIVFERAAKNDTQAQYTSDFKDRFSIAYFCPRNTSAFKFSLSWLEKKIDVDWAVLFLAVGGGYLEYDDIFRFALEKLDDQSDKSVFELALLFFEESPDHMQADAYIEQLVNNIDLESWAVGFLKLFFVSLDWFCFTANVHDEDFGFQLEMVCYDFFDLVIDDDAVGFPFFASCGNHCSGLEAKQKLRQDYRDAARRHLNSLRDIDRSGDELEIIMQSAVTAWEGYGYEGKIPNILSDRKIRDAVFAQYDLGTLKVEQIQADQADKSNNKTGSETRNRKKILAYVAFFVILGLLKVIKHLAE